MKPSKILFIRRDNIGDLICTTPAIFAVKKEFPDAKIGILVNTYNADVIINNPDIDEVYIYEKTKHAPDKSKLSVWLNNFKILRKIRKEKYDVAIGCGSYSPTLARYTFLAGAQMRIGYLQRGMEKSKFYNVPLDEPESFLHEVERVFNLLRPLGIDGTPPPLRIFPTDNDVQRVKDFLNASGFTKGIIIAFHISSRRLENRWPADKFIELGRLIVNHFKVNILLLWSPGSEKSVYHPGDDEKAEYIKNAMNPKPIAYKTVHLKELVSALSLSSLVICCDGGAMHIAAALGKPILAIWGSTDKRRWVPWKVKKVKNIILQKGMNADEVTVEEALAAFVALWNEYRF